uniref:Uncharacterized protein n=1 Tax=Candidatus Kentrum sp. TC TaxID=2126339 RepID=A0A450YCH8_9GAMM|nr:MAG: hypothetical protein BECKTC1821E_GA0114239_100454 [Candidatus Kentron sp. TC]
MNTTGRRLIISGGLRPVLKSRIDIVSGLGWNVMDIRFVGDPSVMTDADEQGFPGLG